MVETVHGDVRTHRPAAHRPQHVLPMESRNAAHIGGLLIGFIIGYAAPVARSHTGREAEWRTRGVLIAVAIFLTATFVGVRRWRHGYAEMDLGRRALITGHTEDGIARLVRV